nr:nuclear pore complex protein Nup98-Nup96-like isoform X1 [Procambarus clarkii]XP_045624503.1 nuclear pore complex protein Nup98-Nup96-like isoform X1 [Procambarus clarkii]XP_045624504.1 nuclear pore complex protein Nup98-Nup96-like isoform X1 [Procambarus clarkii]XP_045624506.1 nuclear pore complex protein Nup98-Nup96-like isoform X1 [Procambarus clarkii]XP_045624507.1 nuclear pore complex protein Nup98-Nup96-like isoform X1 [Procambarus clarkii]XP_045624508.1 nuclear pore complex protein N
MFGQQRAAPFGSTTSTFGTGFGTPSTTTGTTGFGATTFGRSAFGNTQQTTSFGASTTPFGAAPTSSTSLFGTQPQQTSGGLFGQQQPTQTSTSFSQPSTGFGTSGGGLFGQTQQPTGTGLFGSTTTGAFGAQQSTQNRPFGFGQTITSSTSTAGGLFSSTQPATGGGLFSTGVGFGGTGGVSGTTVKYEPVTGSDTMTRNGVSTSIRTKIEVISTMKEYENKSLEELRVEDYLANRKGPGQGTTIPGFGQTQQQAAQPQLGGTGLFGTTSGTSLFSSTKPPENKTLFGSGTSTGFGTPTGGSLFGSTATTPAFGQTSTASNPSFSFNTQQQQQQQKSTGFNFGSTATTSPSLFGSTPQQQQTSGFGLGGGFQLGQTTQQQNTGGLFGNQNKPGGFLSNQNTSGGLFGSKPAGITQPLSTGFGTTSAVTPFGQATNTSAGGGLFGAQNTQNKTGIFSGFNNNSSFGSTGLFGQTNNQQKPGGAISFGQFGSTNTMGQTLGTNTGTGLFNPSGVNTNVGMTGTGLLNTNSAFGMPQLNMMGNAGGGIYTDLGKLVKAMTEKPIFDIPLGSTTSSSSDRSSSTSSNDQGSSKLPSSSLKPTYVLSPSLVSNKPKPKPINKANNQGNDRHWLFKGLEDPSEESSEDFLKPKKYPSVRKLNLKVFKGVKTDSASLGSTPERAHGNSSSDAPSPLTTPISSLGDNSTLRTSGSLSHDNSPTPEIIKGRSKVKRLNLVDKHGQMNDTLVDLNVNHLKVTEPADDHPDADDLVDHDKTDLDAEANKENNVSLFNSVDEEDLPEIINRSSDKPHPAGVKLTRSGYYTLPSLDDLGEMVDSEGRCLVENFTVGRYGYGNVCFLGVTDIASIDLDAVVFILRKQIEVYPEGTQKPGQGQELNKPAVITLDCVWPIDKTTREVIKSTERLESMSWGDYLERQCVKMDANFIEYRPETGSWVFKVKHFSKYGLQEDNDEEDMATIPPKTNQIQPIPPQSGAATQLPALPMHISVPPVTSLTSPPQFGLSQMTMPSLASKQASQPRYLDSPHQDVQVPDDEVMDSSIAKEPEESASLSIMSPSSERLTVLSRVVPRTVQLAKSQMFGADDDDEPLQTTRESTPTPQGPRVSSKKLMLATDSSLNQSRGATMSPVPSEPKARVVLHLQPLAMASPPKANVQTESCPAPPFRDSRCEYEMLPSGCDVGTEVGHVPPQHQTTIVPFASSLMYGLDHCLSDMGAFMGRSFRVGWGPCWNLVHAGTPLASTTMEECSDDVTAMEAAVTHPSPASFLFLGSLASHPKTAPSADSPRYNLMVEKLHTVQPHSHTKHHLTEASLECVLERSILDIDEMSESKDPKCPFFRPAKDIDLLHQLAETAASFGHEDPTISNIFNLCVALWGRLDFYSPESGESMQDSLDGESDYSVSRARVEAVSQWLEAVSHATVQEEVAIALNKDNSEEGYLDAVFAHLTARQISEACVLAQDEGDHHLALLLAQACLGQDAPRQILAQQLANWAEGGTDALMAPSRLALYSLLAAAPTHQASHTTVNTCHGLDWRRAFALHLWYVCPATSTIMEALQEYEQAAGLRGDAPSYCEAPLPPYLAYQALPNGMKASYDICYHLLKLYTDPMHQLEALLNPATITPDPLDVTVSWLLWRILESLNYQHLSRQLSASLHLSMAALMESAGQWHWAIFVLLNINEEERRRKEVRELLQRHVAVGEENESNPKYAMQEDFVISKLSIPKKWIHQAKATKARSLNMVDEEAWYLLKAGEYNRAHMLIVDTIAPNSIINEDHHYLHSFLDQLRDDGVCSTVVDWAIGGGVYADYLDVCSVVEDMKKSADPTPAMLEQLRPRLLALCSRLNNLKCQTATHRLCVSEMSRVVVGVLRAVLGEGTDATQVLSQQLSGLPLTHDYALTELNMVTTHYLTHLSAET